MPTGSMILSSRVRLHPRCREGAASGEVAERHARASVFQATTATQLDDVRALMRAFVAWHRDRHAEDSALIDRYFDEEAFARELAELPGKYAPPAGRLLVAYRGGRPAGCVALRDLGDGAAEMKRMFVPEAFRGLGIGRALAQRIVEEARELGYRRLRLDTSHRQMEAIRLYEGLGFRRVPPYYALTPALQHWLVFFERTL